MSFLAQFPPLVNDARADSLDKIKEGIVKGVLAETGLPSLNSIITGNGSVESLNHYRFTGGKSKKDTPASDSLLEIPRGDVPATAQMSGVARYLASQKKK